MINLVELIDADESTFDQACRYGNRVGNHSVYCHNNTWKDAPRKCRCSWYTGGKERDEDCPGFKPNLNKEQETDNIYVVEFWDFFDNYDVTYRYFSTKIAAKEWLKLNKFKYNKEASSISTLFTCYESKTQKANLYKESLLTVEEVRNEYQ